VRCAKIYFSTNFQDHPSQPGHHTLNQFSSSQITEWNNENVRHWLIGIEMERYAPLFTEKSVTGPQLVAMDSNKLKVLYIFCDKFASISMSWD
jgi:hypothetical protein